MFKKTLAILFLLLYSVMPVWAADETESGPAIDTSVSSQVFEARVTKVLDERDLVREDGSKNHQQDLELAGLEGKWKGKTMTYRGVGDLDVASSNVYRAGDKVLVEEEVGPDGQPTYYVQDFVRSGWIYGLGLIFAIVIVLVGQIKGVKSLLSLIISFLIIVWFIIPRIIAGSNPLVVSVLGSLAILAVILYLTEGWNIKSHIAVLSVLISLVITYFLSWLFTEVARLTGMASEETIFLIGATKQAIDFKGLLLASFLIGTIGVIDDVVVGQVEAVEQIMTANPRMGKIDAFKSAYKVGNAHLGAIINTLFLTYAGASLPLLLLFSASAHGPYVNGINVLNNENIATEIVRTLVGSIGIALSLPITTILAVRWMVKGH